MSIVLTPFHHDPLCHGSSWTVRNEDLLVGQIARVAVGQAHHVERILAGATGGPPPTPATAIAGAVAMLTVNAGDDSFHRDGWIFQVMSWIAAHTANPGAVIRPPHMILADKGFDGLQLVFDHAGQAVTAAVIFEDKATDNARRTIREDVWPTVSEIETGARDNYLAAEVVALLTTRPTINADTAIANIIWSSARHYRVSITVGAIHSSAPGRLRLFRGYDGIVTGPLGRRRAETIELNRLRDWMDAIAARTITAIQNMGAVNV